MSAHRSRMLRFVLCVAAAWLVASGCAAPAADNGDTRPEHLRFVLILTRHGIRSPTWSAERLQPWAAKPWPQWPVAPGLLTPHGKQLMTIFGSYYAELYRSEGLLAGTGCTPAHLLFMVADTDERTVETARGLAAGLVPGCTIPIHTAAENPAYAVFHPSRGGDPATAVASVEGRIGGDPAALTAAYAEPLGAMQTVLNGCDASPAHTVPSHLLAQSQASVSPGNGDHLVEFKGPLATAATFAENLQLEYLEGMPLPSVGWGCAGADHVLSLMSLHAAASGIVQRSPYVARTQAAALLAAIGATLTQAERGAPVSGAIGPSGAQVVFLAGHDTNIANVAAALNADWLIPGYQPNDAVPGGALVFELWQGPGQQDEVRVSYTAQTPLQMRETLPLTLSRPPGRSAVYLPACSGKGSGYPCSWKQFVGLF